MKFMLIKSNVRNEEMYRLFLIAVIMMISFSSSAQEKLTKRNIVDKDGRKLIHFLSKKHSDTKSDTLTYYWHYANSIKKTQGGYEGNLLHGDYSKFDKEDNLMERGHFKKGLKTKQWKKWDSNGKLLLDEHWKGGLRNGEQYVYNEGVLIAKYRFKNGMRHGKSYLYKSGILDVVVSYRKGKQVESNEGRIRIKKIPLKEKIIGRKEDKGTGDNVNEEDKDDSEKRRRIAKREKRKAHRKVRSNGKKESKGRKTKKKKKGREEKAKRK